VAHSNSGQRARPFLQRRSSIKFAITPLCCSPASSDCARWCARESLKCESASSTSPAYHRARALRSALPPCSRLRAKLPTIRSVQHMLSLMQPPYSLAAYMLLVILSHAYPSQYLMRRCHQSSFSFYTVAHCRLLLIDLVL
jgi:hypothetical protein